MEQAIKEIKPVNISMKDFDEAFKVLASIKLTKKEVEQNVKKIEFNQDGVE